MEPRLNIITLGVSDLEKSRKFYQKGMGFPVSQMSTPNIVFFKTGGICLALYPHDRLADDITLPNANTLETYRGVTIAHNTKNRKEVDTILNQAKEAGAVIVKPASEAFWGGYSGYFSDPDGHLWEIAYGDFWKFDKRGSLILD